MTTLREVLNAPADLTVRRAYGAALEQQKQPLGRFIRLQCDAEQADGDPSRALAREAWDLARDHEREWLAPLFEIPSIGAVQRGPLFTQRRGLVEHLCVDEEMVGDFDAICERAPIVSIEGRVHRHRDAWRIRDLAGSKRIEQVHSFRLSELHAPLLVELAKRARSLRLRAVQTHVGSPAELNDLMAWDAFDGIESLELRCDHTETASKLARWIGTDPRFAKLDTLVLDAPLGKSDVALLAGANFPRLRRFALRRALLRTAATRVLAKALWLPQLEFLELSGCALGQAITDVVKVASRVSTLVVAGPRGLSAKAMPALVDGLGGLPSLRSLCIRDNVLRHKAAHALAVGAQSVRGLEHLDLSGLALQDAGVKWFATARWPKLVSLDLSRNGIGPPGMDGLAQSGCLERVRFLNLATNKFQNKGALALAAAPKLALESLTLAFNWMGKTGVAAILKHPGVCGLRELRAGTNNYADAPLLELAKSSLRLETLIVRGVSSGSLRAFCGSEAAKELRHFDANYVSVDRDDAADTVDHLSAAPNLGNVIRLQTGFGYLRVGVLDRLHARFGHRIFDQRDDPELSGLPMEVRI